MLSGERAEQVKAQGGHALGDRKAGAAGITATCRQGLGLSDAEAGADLGWPRRRVVGREASRKGRWYVPGPLGSPAQPPFLEGSQG